METTSPFWVQSHKMKVMAIAVDWDIKHKQPIYMGGDFEQVGLLVKDLELEALSLYD